MNSSAITLRKKKKEKIYTVVNMEPGITESLLILYLELGKEKEDS